MGESRRGEEGYLDPFLLPFLPSAKNLLTIQVAPSRLPPMIKTPRWLAIIVVAARREGCDLALEPLSLGPKAGSAQEAEGSAETRNSTQGDTC